VNAAEFMSTSETKFGRVVVRSSMQSDSIACAELKEFRSILETAGSARRPRCERNRPTGPKIEWLFVPRRGATPPALEGAR